MRNAKSRDQSAPGTILPKMVDVSLSFNPVHEHTVGWDVGGASLDGKFPYGVELQRAAAFEGEKTWQERVEKIRDEELKRDQAQAMIDNAKARYAGMLGKARLKRDQRRLAVGTIKNPEKRAYIASTVAGSEYASMEEGGITSTEVASIKVK